MSRTKTSVGPHLNLIRVHLDKNGVDRTGKPWGKGLPVWHYDGEGRSPHHGYLRARNRGAAKTAIRRLIGEPRATFYNGL